MRLNCVKLTWLCFIETWFHYKAQADFECAVLFPLAPEFWSGSHQTGIWEQIDFLIFFRLRDYLRFFLDLETI